VKKLKGTGVRHIYTLRHSHCTQPWNLPRIHTTTHKNYTKSTKPKTFYQADY